MQVWPVMHTDLTEYGLTSCPPSKVRDSSVSLESRVRSVVAVQRRRYLQSLCSDSGKALG